MSFRRCRLIAGIACPSGPSTRPRIEPDPAAAVARRADSARTARVTSKAARRLESDLTMGCSSVNGHGAGCPGHGRAAYDRPTRPVAGGFWLGLRRTAGRLVAARRLKSSEGPRRRDAVSALESKGRSEVGAD